jgi:hypothetical protein
MGKRKLVSCAENIPVLIFFDFFLSGAKGGQSGGQ